MAKNLPVIVPVDGANHAPTLRTRRLVASLVAVGLTEEEIAVSTGIQPLDLRRYYQDEMRHGQAITTARIGNALVKQAIKGDHNAQRLYLQARARWVVPTKVEMTGKDGGPIEIEERRKITSSILDRIRRLERRQEQAPPLDPGKGNGKPGPGADKPRAVH